jgi:signal transduction histidine kinase
VTVRRRLTTSSVFIALIAVLVLGIPLGIVEAARVRTDWSVRLEREADAVAGVVDAHAERGQPVSAGLVAPLVRPGHRVTVTVGGRTIVAGARLGPDIVAANSGTSRAAHVVAAAPRGDLGAQQRRSWLLIGALGVGGVVIAFALAAAQARRLSRPLEAVAASSARLGEGDFSVRVPRSGVPEIDAIAASLDRSAERIARLVGREREFSSNVSHQLRTPLTALRLRLEESAHDPQAETLEAAVREADRLEATVAALLRYARAESAGERVPTALDAIAAEHVRNWQPLAARAGRRLELADGAGGGRPLAVLASRGTVGQVLDVLLDNALRHGRGPIRVELAADERWVTLAIEDRGEGVPADAQELIFERGTSPAGGTGIGLHLARALVVSDGGALRLTRAAPPRFELRLRRPADDNGHDGRARG